MKSSKREFGFTLLEVLIALTLVVTLMGLCWSLFATFSRLETRARKTVAGLEISRTLARQLQDDLDQVVQIQVSEPGGESESPATIESSIQGLLDSAPDLANELTGVQSGSFSSTETDAVSETGEGSLRQYAGEPFFRGEPERLSFVVSSANLAQGAFPKHQWVVITYEWQGEHSTGNLQDELKSELNLDSIEELNSSTEEDTGLELGKAANRVFVRSVMSFEDFISGPTVADTELNSTAEFETIEIGRSTNTTSSIPSEAHNHTDRIPEIQKLSFRYFDGKSWRQSWSDSRTLPMAIEAVFKIRREGGTQDDSPIAPEESGLDFGDEIETGRGSSESDDFEFATSYQGGEFNINPDFDSESKRVVIRLGTRQHASQEGVEETSLPVATRTLFEDRP